jgi:hypothetical protein
MGESAVCGPPGLREDTQLSRAGQSAGSRTYKNFVRVFKEGIPPGLREDTQLSQSSPFVIQSLSGVPEALLDKLVAILVYIFN